MAKVSGSYKSVAYGVSRQVPHDRGEGQHWEQINCISDITRGVVRRHGSKHETTKVLGDYDAGTAQAFLDDVKTYRSYDFLVGDDQYTLVYRKKPKVANSEAPLCFCFNKQTRQFLNVVIEDEDELVEYLEANGVSAITNVGRYLYIASNGYRPNYTVVDNVNSTANKSIAAAWVRQGNYSKTYTLKVYIRRTSDNAQFVVEGSYETMPSAYPGVLDTSMISADDPEYQKKVNDITNAYNTAVTQHIEIAAKDVLQANIAQQIVESLEDDRASQSLDTALIFEINEATIGVKTTAGYVIENLTAQDRGDGTSFLAVSNTVGIVDELTAEHYPGKIVKVRPKKSDESDSYYMQAVKREDDSVISGLQEVTWIQAAGETTSIDSAFAFATIENGVFYLAGSASGLQTLSGVDEVPGFEPSKVGDTLSNNIPTFLGEQIHYLGSFQDRLVVGYKSTLTFSRPGRYLDFFRQDVLTVVEDDPVEMYPTGSEDDTIVASEMFQGSLLLFGQRKQYLINGRQKFTPMSGIVSIVGANEDSVDMDPIAAGNFVFYAKGRLGYSSLHQFQGGVVADTPETYDVSSFVDKYIPGNPVQGMALTTPNTILLRTDGKANGIYLYNYLDSADGGNREYEAWHRWEWHPSLGQIVGWTFSRGDISIFTVRHGQDWSGNPKWFLVSDKFTLDAKLDNKPYLDSQRPYTTYITEPENEWFTDQVEDAYVAFNDSVRQHLIGHPLDKIDQVLQAYPEQEGALEIGIGFEAWFSPTNPYMRDRQGKAIIDARTVISQFVVSCADTAAVEATIHTKAKPEGYLAGYSNGRDLGRLVAELGIQPISSGKFQFIVGRENNEFEYRVKAVKWFPFNVTGITWIGQFFSRTNRVT